MTASLPSRFASQRRVRTRDEGRSGGTATPAFSSLSQPDLGVAPLPVGQLGEAGRAVGVLLHRGEPLVEGRAVPLVLQVLEPDVGSGCHGRGM